MIETAKAILARGDAVLIFVEGTRIRPGALGRPRRGVGRLALETGAPVVPVAVIGTEAIRKGWRIRPHKVRIRVGAPLTFPQVQAPSRALAAAVTDRIWPCVMLQWEWLGGLPPLRRAAVIGAGSWGTAVATMLARAGLEVDLGCRTARPGRADRATARQRRVPARRRAAGVGQRHARVRARALAPRPRVLRRPGRRAARRGRGPRRRDPAAHRRARDVQGPRAAARDAAVGVRRRARRLVGRRRPRRARARRRPRSATAPRSSSARATPPSAARSPTR